MVDLVKQLREVNERDFHPDSLRTMVLWAADEIEKLRLQWTGMRDEVRLCHTKIERLTTTLKGIEVYATSKDDAKGMAAKTLLDDRTAGPLNSALS